MRNRIRELYEKMPFTFCVVVTRSMWGKHSAIVADFKQLKKFDYEASEGRINFELRLSRFNKLYPIINTIGELELTEDEQEWLMKNKSKFKEAISPVYEKYDAQYGKLLKEIEKAKEE